MYSISSLFFDLLIEKGIISQDDIKA